MEIVQNPWVAVAIVVGLVLVLLYALSRRSGKLDVKIGGVSASVDKNAPGREREVSVARNLEVEREATVGNITGARGGADVVAGRPVDVASGARIRGTVGDITGIDASGKSGS